MTGAKAGAQRRVPHTRRGLLRRVNGDDLDVLAHDGFDTIPPDPFSLGAPQERVPKGPSVTP